METTSPLTNEATSAQISRYPTAESVSQELLTEQTMAQGIFHIPETQDNGVHQISTPASFHTYNPPQVPVSSTYITSSEFNSRFDRLEKCILDLSASFKLQIEKNTTDITDIRTQYNNLQADHNNLVTSVDTRCINIENSQHLINKETCNRLDHIQSFLETVTNDTTTQHEKINQIVADINLTQGGLHKFDKDLANKNKHIQQHKNHLDQLDISLSKLSADVTTHYNRFDKEVENIKIEINTIAENVHTDTTNTQSRFQIIKEVVPGIINTMWSEVNDEIEKKLEPITIRLNQGNTEANMIANQIQTLKDGLDQRIQKILDKQPILNADKNNLPLSTVMLSREQPPPPQRSPSPSPTSQQHDARTRQENSPPLHPALQHIDIKLENFSGTSIESPIRFLKAVDIYFELLPPISDLHKITVVGQALRGIASDWYANVRMNINTYEAFVRAFRGKFWNETRQQEVRKKLMDGRYNNKDSDLTCDEYAARILQEVSELDYQILPQDIIFYLLQHYAHLQDD